MMRQFNLDYLFKKKYSQRPRLFYICNVIGLKNHKHCPKVMRAGVAQVKKVGSAIYKRH